MCVWHVHFTSSSKASIKMFGRISVGTVREVGAGTLLKGL
jgi:hypothetical protein